MAQMLTGVLPYDTPSPDDMERLMRGDLVTPPRLRNSAIPKAVSDIVMKAMAPDVSARYQRARDVLADLVAAGSSSRRRTPSAVAATTASDEAQRIHQRLRSREAPAARFCWHCHKPLPARPG